MMRLIFFAVLPCVLARKTQRSKFLVEVVHAAPTDVEAQLAASLPSSVACSALCSSKDYVSFTFTLGTNLCYCFSGVSDQVEQDVSGTSGIYYGKYVFPQDCLGWLARGYTTDGVYVIQPPGGTVTETWCDMADGGWTVWLRRQDGSENFTREWAAYEAGFGNRAGEYWLGLETLHLLTSTPSSLRVYTEVFADMFPSTAYAVYDVFSVGDASTNYRLTVSGFTGDCNDSLTYHDGHMFTTIDRDNDGWSEGNCAEKHKGGFWYDWCRYANPTGKYFAGGGPSNEGLRWYPCYHEDYSAKVFILKLKSNM